MHTIRSILLLIVLAACCPPIFATDHFVPLFDGKTLNGWNPLPGGTWEVADGVLVGRQESTEARHGILLSEKQYGDFIVRLKFKSLAGNSGLYFRAEGR